VGDQLLLAALTSTDPEGDAALSPQSAA
jgi:hypothetical protein